jgi:hypothetical protein
MIDAQFRFNQCNSFREEYISVFSFFSETTNMIKAKLYMNVHWVVLYKLYVFCCDMKFQMAATAGLSMLIYVLQWRPSWISDRHKKQKLCRGPSNDHSWAVWFQLNDHWKVLYIISVLYADRKSKMAATAMHKLALNPMEECSNAFFSETTNMIKAKLY